MIKMEKKHLLFIVGGVFVVTLSYLSFKILYGPYILIWYLGLLCLPFFGVVMGAMKKKHAKHGLFIGWGVLAIVQSLPCLFVASMNPNHLFSYPVDYYRIVGFLCLLFFGVKVLCRGVPVLEHSKTLRLYLGVLLILVCIGFMITILASGGYQYYIAIHISELTIIIFAIAVLLLILEVALIIIDKYPTYAEVLMNGLVHMVLFYILMECSTFIMI